MLRRKRERERERNDTLDGNKNRHCQRISSCWLPRLFTRPTTASTADTANFLNIHFNSSIQFHFCNLFLFFRFFLQILKRKRDDEEMASRRSKQATPPAASSSRCSLLFFTVLVLTAAPGVRSQQSDSNSNNNDLFQCPEGLSCLFFFNLLVSSFLDEQQSANTRLSPIFAILMGRVGRPCECVCRLVIDNNLTCRRRRRRRHIFGFVAGRGKRAMLMLRRRKEEEEDCFYPPSPFI